MATHSRILAWRIPWTEEPGGLQSTGLQRVRNPTEQLNNNNSIIAFFPPYHLLPNLFSLSNVH